MSEVKPMPTPNPFSSFTPLDWVWFADMMRSAARQRIEDYHRRLEAKQWREEHGCPDEKDEYVKPSPRHLEAYWKFFTAAQQLHHQAEQDQMQKFAGEMAAYWPAPAVTDPE